MTRIIGHRGARNLWPENSMTGFRNVRDLAIEAVEFDVHLSDFGEMLIMHDPTLERTTDASGPTRRLSPSQRIATRLKQTDESVPLLDDVLSLFNGTGFTVHIEIKTDGDGTPYPGLESMVIDALSRHGLTEHSRITSFSIDILKECRSLAPNIPRIFAVNPKAIEQHGFDVAFDRALDVADFTPVQMGLLAREWDRIRAKVPLERLGAWVPNTEEELRKWLSCGLYQITTDRPDLALSVRKALETGQKTRRSHRCG